MEFDNSFEVPLPPEQAWKVLMDIPGIAPCMPGAELTEIVDPQNYKGRIAVRLGPVALSFAGRVTLDEIDEAGHSARVTAQGNDAKGRGSANATATFRIEPAAAGSRVVIHTDLTLSGAVAQYGRGVGMIQATAAQIVSQFAGNLRAQLARQSAPPPPPPQEVEAPPTVPSADDAFAPAPPPRRNPPPPRASAAPPAPAAMPPAAKPISGFSLMARVLWSRLLALFGGGRS